jgi:hypothetical protein
MSACGAGLEVQDIGTLGGLHGTASASGSTAIAINDKGEIFGVPADWPTVRATQGGPSSSLPDFPGPFPGGPQLFKEHLVS